MSAPARPIFHAEIGKYLADLREAKGWSQLQAIDIARRRGIDLSVGPLRFLEQGMTKHPDAELLKAVAQLYELPYEHFAMRFVAANYGPSVRDLTRQAKDQKSGSSSHVGDLTNDPAAARILKLESENTELRTALAEVAHVAGNLVQIAKVGEQGDSVGDARPARRRRDRKTG